MEKISPQSLDRVASPKSWTTISTDVVLENLLSFLSKLTRIKFGLAASPTEIDLRAISTPTVFAVLRNG
jgi:hypothetical protein